MAALQRVLSLDHIRTPLNRPIEGFSKSTHDLYSENDESCAVCLSESGADTTLLPCGHTFHGKCILTWVQSNFTCPLCRQEIQHFLPAGSAGNIMAEFIQTWNEHYQTKSKKPKISSNKNDDILTERRNKKSIMDTPTRKLKQIDTDICEFGDPVPMLLSLPEELHDIPSEEVHKCVFSDVDSAVDSLRSDTGPLVTEKANIWKLLWNTLIDTSTSVSPPTFAIQTVPLLGDDFTLDYLKSDNMSHKLDTFDLCDDIPIVSYEFNEYKPQQYQNKAWFDDGLYQSNDDLYNYIESEPIYDDVFVPTRSIKSAVNTSVPSMDKTARMNLKSGTIAGVVSSLMSVGCTTFVMANSLSVQNIVRSTIHSTVVDTVPRVAVFFTGYEHMKTFVYGTDGKNKTGVRTFGERFVCATAAATLAYMPQNISGCILPLRFGVFFGVFEGLKDIQSYRISYTRSLHGSEVAMAATIGGVVASAIYYPVSQIPNIPPLLMHGNNRTIGINSVYTIRSVYRGWGVHLSKFMAPCVACSCAFEFAHRYFARVDNL